MNSLFRRVRQPIVEFEPSRGYLQLAGTGVSASTGNQPGGRGDDLDRGLVLLPHSPSIVTPRLGLATAGQQFQPRGGQPAGTARLVPRPCFQRELAAPEDVDSRGIQCPVESTAGLSWRQVIAILTA